MAVQGAVMVPHPPLIIPEVGKGRERDIQATIDAYRAAARQAAAWRPETVVIVSPHSVMYADYFHISPGEEAEGDLGQFGAPQVRIRARYDTAFVKLLCQEAQARGISAGTLGERDPRLDHGTLIPLWFLDQYDTEYQVARIGLSGLPFSCHYQLGQCIKKAAELLDRRVVVIGSGDLSHRLKADGPYGYRAEGPEYDRRIMDVMGTADFGGLFDFSEDFCENAAECGHRSFLILAGALDRLEVKARKLSYEGPFGVGYGVCVYEAGAPEPERNYLDRYEDQIREEAKARKAAEDPYVKLARAAVESYVGTGKKAEIPLDLPREMYGTRAGVFVSLKEGGKLRGCIGTIAPTQNNVAEEIIANAVSAAARDPRFDPVEPEELDRLVYSVDVLGEAEEIDSQEELDVKRYGVIVTRGHKRGLLLPDLEGIETVEEQVAVAKRKAGIPEGAKDIRLERFEVVRHF
ncbi:MAG TPA: AmmeMemoRadiSam system protein A [Candidatus Dorea gallistercoris]|uniref:AmmeMemoRadiSam system protein A n=1 Tax=Candidatus Dorea gallistercoris TaxID=2838542 RepID=A0A9D1R8F4_9FIRM|nr:AmmeMemoRadiSam system protein A [Candidatus Dorea gallistercoris]